VLWRLDPRSLYEQLAELGRERLLRSCLEAKVRRYVDALTPELLAPVKANRFPPAPVHVVGR
jgi:hypothetical protein